MAALTVAVQGHEMNRIEHEPKTWRKVLGVCQLILSLVGFMAIGAVGGAYWSMDSYERQLTALRADDRREIDYIARMLETLVAQVVAADCRSHLNARKIDQAREDASRALSKAQELAQARAHKPTLVNPTVPYYAPTNPVPKKVPRPTHAPPPPGPPAAGETNPGERR